MRSFVLACAIAVSSTQMACAELAPLGDWFFCKTAECDGLDSEGLRFVASGQVYVLRAPGNQYEPGEEKYCEDHVYGTYSLHDDVLTVKGDDETRSFLLSQNGEVMSLRPGDDTLSMLLKLVEEDSSGPCL